MYDIEQRIKDMLEGLSNTASLNEQLLAEAIRMLARELAGTQRFIRDIIPTFKE